MYKYIYIYIYIYIYLDSPRFTRTVRGLPGQSRIYQDSLGFTWTVRGLPGQSGVYPNSLGFTNDSGAGASSSGKGKPTEEAKEFITKHLSGYASHTE
jgi:hypothetical protein